MSQVAVLVHPVRESRRRRISRGCPGVWVSDGYEHVTDTVRRRLEVFDQIARPAIDERTFRVSTSSPEIDAVRGRKLVHQGRFQIRIHERVRARSRKHKRGAQRIIGEIEARREATAPSCRSGVGEVDVWWIPDQTVGANL